MPKFSFLLYVDIPCPPLTLERDAPGVSYRWLLNDKRLLVECLQPYYPINGTGQLDCMRNGTWIGSIPLCAGKFP